MLLLFCHCHYLFSQVFIRYCIILSDGANGIKYNLTNDIIESIFKTYPAVKRKHAENVPAKMKEQEFWWALEILH